MSATSVSIVAPAGAKVGRSCEPLERYLESTGFTFEILTPESEDYGVALRKGISEATGEIIVVIDAALPYPIQAIGDAVALVQSGSADVVFGTTPSAMRPPDVVRWLIVDRLPDPVLKLAAFSSTAGKVVVGETRLPSDACLLEVAYLANKYGFRVESLLVDFAAPPHSWTLSATLGPAIAIRRANRKNFYRAPRRCPVCFSSEVWSCAQLPGNVVRGCRRCKCRYLNQFVDEEGTQPVRRLAPPIVPPGPPAYESHSAPARERTSLRRMNWVQRQIPSRARLLEVGVRDGSFGTLAATDYEYVGIDPAQAAARHARARGLEVYCSTLSGFVNTGPAFDAITLFHVFENLPDPHDALSRIKDLLKPGGALFLSTFDTEGLIYLMTERKRMGQNFRTHLILYSRSALIELLERSGFEIVDIAPEFEYRDQKFLRHWFSSHHPLLAPAVRALLRILPDPSIVTTGSIRIVAKRRSGMPFNVRAIRSVEPTHAR